MKHAIVLTLATLASVGAAGSADAKTYNIQLSSFCDAYTLKVSKDFVVGASIASNCDDSFLVGSTAKLSAKVLPSGSVLAVAGDLGAAPNQYILYFNLKTGQEMLYGTTDGKTITTSSSAFTITSDGPAVITGRPAQTSHMHKVSVAP